MYVKKFEGEKLDEVLKSVKMELGPDAIILKTITNKGLKGAFKKSRIEITAAISEQNYEKKSKVDHVLTTDQKEKFYSDSASEVNRSIQKYNESIPKNNGGYGAMGLNKVVNTVSKASSKIKNGLDDFLSATSSDEEDAQPTQVVLPEATGLHTQSNTQSNLINQVYSSKDYAPEEVVSQTPIQTASTEVALELRHQLKTQQNQIELLERKLFELTKNLSVTENHCADHQGVKDLKTTLKTLDLSDKIVSDIIKKAKFELSNDDLEDPDIVYDFALRQLHNSIQVDMPLFSSVHVQNRPVVTVLLSETACGQGSMALKLAVLQEGVKVIKLRKDMSSQAISDFTSQVFKLDISHVSSLAHLMSESRKAISENRSIILDIKTSTNDKDESKKMIETLKRSFEHIEFLLNLSAINSEMYNRKILSKYKDFADGVIITYMDQCLNYGSLLNMHYANANIPFKFFGTGATVPDDIEAATSERILAGMFEF